MISTLNLLLLILCFLRIHFFGLQPEPDGRTLAGRALGLYLAAVGFDDGRAHRQPDAHAVLTARRGILRQGRAGEEGLEPLFRDAAAVVDDFERALQNIRKSDDVEAVKEGVELIYSKFMAYLAQQGVKAIEAVGQPFDTELFEAVATIPAPEPGLKGKILDCVQTGYTLNDRVLRHAKVVVGE